MSVVTARPARPTRAVTVRSLAQVEARRYARHPLFLIGLAVMVGAMLVVSKDMAQGTDGATMGLVDAVFLPTFLLGLLGVVVGVQLTRSMAKSTEPVQASPTDGVARTAALCLATAVPGVAALVWLVWLYTVSAVWPNPPSALTAGDLAAIRGAGVIAAVGGPLFGIMVGRWTRLPGAGLIAVVVLYVWVASTGSIGADMEASRLSNLLRLNAPSVGWLAAADSPDGQPLVAGGSPWWHLMYMTLLCGLATTAAMLREARGAQRSLLTRTFGVIAALALVALTLTVLADPTRIPL